METEQKKGRTIVNLKKLGTILLVMSALMIIVAACDSDDPVATREGVAVESTPTVETPTEAPTTPTIEPVVFDLNVCAVTLAVQLPIEFEYAGTIPTGFDGINRANCTFTKAVETVTVTLTGPATHSETFTLSELTTDVSFPLPEGTVSETTVEIVPPGGYQREMTATSVDGETLVISDQPGVLKTVTILEPVVFEAGPCRMTLAAQLPIEFEYKGTIPTGFDGINRAGCTFTKVVETVTVTLTGPATHTEVFTLGEPSAEVAFPLPEGTLSISTLEIVPPGEYQREMTVTSVDGETLVVSDQPGVLKTVTILEPVVFETGPCRITLAAQLPIEFEYKGTIPTGFDGINRANCTFTKAVKTVTVTLSGPATHSEVFTLAEPTTQVSFPLPEGTLSISTLEIVPPGEYQREMTATSVDGDTLVVSDQPGVLKTVTILEPVVFDVGPCRMTLAAQLPIEFEYKGTIPTGFDGINRANCTFTKAVETVTVTLTGPATHSEVFTLGEPSTEVAFPLPEGTLSLSTLEIVPPGEYQREMTVTSVDGDTLVVSDQPGVLKTVTILEPVVFEAGPCSMTRAAQLPIEFEYKGTIPTGFDGINRANCTFTKAVETLTVTLTGPTTHTEVFTLGEPSTEVAFPLPEGTLSISTLEIVPPGEYQREMTVTSVDGETLVVSDQPGVLKTVTILEPVVFDLNVCAVTLATQLPIEFEYKGTIPTGFDGINRANCTFTKAVETVTVTLTGPATHTEIFTLAEPTTQISFPLPEGTLSISTLEIVPPGEYQREMTVTSVDGETLVVSDQPGVLKTVTILEPVVFDLNVCAVTLATQLPIEFEYKGTIPSGFDGINRANCTFTKAVETVTVTLTGPATHTEIFTLAEPTTQISFPLPEGTLSISTLEIVPPGEYQREIKVTSVDGETLIISDQPGVLKTVTILEPTEFTFGFENDDQDWTTGFADLPENFDQTIYELDSGYRPLPNGLEGSGVFLQGHNRSDDLFMFLKRQVEGLGPETAYNVTISLDLATNVPAGLLGIGGSPGESVYVKAGASSVEPIIEVDDTGHLRMNIDKGNQAREGESMINLGNVAHPDVAGDEYKIKTLDNQGRPLEVVSDGEGRVWLIVGTDSGFEGLSAFYYDRINYVFSLVQ